MELSKYSLEDIILTALKSEVDAIEYYLELANRVKNALVKEKLEFLANEEEKHKIFLENLYNEKFPQNEIILPGKTPVPLPELKLYDSELLSKVFENAMDAEATAKEFYLEFSKRFPKDSKTKTILEYFASMEEGHYKLLEIERRNITRFESLGFIWPMLNV